MLLFAKGIPRLAVLAIAVAVLVLVPTNGLSHGPNICIWTYLFHLQACPACGSTRALSSFFHGELTEALAFNRNVAVTAPMLVFLIAQDVIVLTRRLMRRPARELVP